MAAINHIAQTAPYTKKVVLDGTVQQVQFPPNTRYISTRFRVTAGSYKLQSHAAGSSSDMLAQEIDVWYSHPVGEGQQTPSGDKSYLYIQGTAAAEVDIEYSVVGGR